MRSASFRVFNAGMGTWGAGPLDNDDAMDFVDGLLDLSPGEAVERLLEAVEVAAGTASTLDYPPGATALAAIAVLANSSLPGNLRVWRASLPVTLTPAFAEVMREAIERVLSVGSELTALWAASGKARELAEGVTPLVKAVTVIGVDPSQPTLF